MKNRLLSGAETELILGGCDTFAFAKENVNYAENGSGVLRWECTKNHPIKCSAFYDFERKAVR